MEKTIESTQSVSTTAVKQSTRDYTLDLIRIIAFCSVVCVHFFLNNNFYHVPVAGKKMYVAVLVRTFFMDCVPLFLILSGYLLNKKKLSSRYYLGIFNTYFTYAAAAICCLLYKTTYSKIAIHEGILSVLNFSASPYAWYIEMYLGLFLLIPFLNLIYHNLSSKRQKQVLLLTLLFMTALSPILNVRFKIIPAWWQNFYPVAYYFAGCYLSEYPIKVKNRYLTGLLLLHVILAGSYNYHKSYGGEFIWGSWATWGSLFNVITAVLVFSIIKNLHMEKLKPWITRLIQQVAGLCLGAYLLSWIFDSVFYPILNEHVPETLLRFKYMPVMVPAVILASLAGSFVITGISRFLSKHMKNFIERFM